MTRLLTLIAVAALLVCPHGVASQHFPPAEQLPELAVNEWVEIAVTQAELLEDPAEADEIAINLLWAMGQTPEPPAGVLVRAEEFEQRIRERGMDDADAALAFGDLAYVYARLGHLEKAEALLAEFDDPEQRVEVIVQMAYGTAERGEEAATRQLVDRVEQQLQEMDEWDRDWLTMDLPLVSLLLGDARTANMKLQGIVSDPAAKLYALTLAADMALDLGQDESVAGWLRQAETLRQIMGVEDDLYDAVVVAAIRARQGEVEAAEPVYARALLAGDAYLLGGFASHLAEAQHEAGDAAGAERTIRKLMQAVAEAEPVPEEMEALDIAYLWIEVAVACREAERMDLLVEAWDRAATPLNRGIMAAGLANEIAWQQWLEARQGGQ